MHSNTSSSHVRNASHISIEGGNYSQSQHNASMQSNVSSTPSTPKYKLRFIPSTDGGPPKAVLADSLPVQVGVEVQQHDKVDAYPDGNNGVSPDRQRAFASATPPAPTVVTSPPSQAGSQCSLERENETPSGSSTRQHATPSSTSGTPLALEHTGERPRPLSAADLSSAPTNVRHSDTRSLTSEMISTVAASTPNAQHLAVLQDVHAMISGSGLPSNSTSAMSTPSRWMEPMTLNDLRAYYSGGDSTNTSGQGGVAGGGGEAGSPAFTVSSASQVAGMRRPAPVSPSKQTPTKARPPTSPLNQELVSPSKDEAFTDLRNSVLKSGKK